MLQPPSTRANNCAPPKVTTHMRAREYSRPRGLGSFTGSRLTAARPTPPRHPPRAAATAHMRPAGAPDTVKARDGNPLVCARLTPHGRSALRARAANTFPTWQADRAARASVPSLSMIDAAAERPRDRGNLPQWRGVSASGDGGTRETEEKKKVSGAGWGRGARWDWSVPARPLAGGNVVVVPVLLLPFPPQPGPSPLRSPAPFPLLSGSLPPSSLFCSLPGAVILFLSPGRWMDTWLAPRHLLRLR